jgi:hypothetical protein
MDVLVSKRLHTVLMLLVFCVRVCVRVCVCVCAVGYTMDVMYFGWLSDPVEIDPGIQLPQFKLKEYLLYDCSQNYTGGQ